MKTINKKIIFLCCLFIFAIIFPIFNVFQGVSAETAPKYLDMYLIAGQSNAAGYSNKGSLNETFENVGYAGEVDVSIQTGVPLRSNLGSISEYNWSVTSGLGIFSDRIGPEYGIAKYINKAYSGSRKAFIFKSAGGGTPLRDLEHSFGNWYPRSKWAEGYVPQNGSVNSKSTGVQYKLFVDNFAKVYNELKENGYTPIVKGMAWMQGCADLGAHLEYERLLKAFIQDIRADLTEITGTNLEGMPFVIGKIATSFGMYNNLQAKSFNTMQQRVADSMMNVATVETSDLIIVNEDGTVNGTDKYHFNATDAQTLGMRFGEKLYDFGQRDLCNIQKSYCKVEYDYDANDNLVLKFTPYKNYKMKSVTVNGVDVTNDLVDGVLTIEKSGSTVNVSAVCEQLAKFNFTYEDISEYGLSYQDKVTYCYEGGTLRVWVKGERKVLKVKLGEQELIYNEERNCFEINPTAGGHISVVVEPLPETPNPTDTEKETGCASTISLTSISVLFAIAFVFVFKKCKE